MWRVGGVPARGVWAACRLVSEGESPGEGRRVACGVWAACRPVSEGESPGEGRRVACGVWAACRPVSEGESPGEGRPRGPRWASVGRGGVLLPYTSQCKV
jgi:hypothetical protein